MTKLSDEVQQYITLVGGVLGIVATIVGFVMWLWKKWRVTIRVKRIVTSQDPDFADLCRLHQRLFSDHVADDYMDLERWLDEDSEARKRGDKRLDDMLFVAKSGAAVVGYLYAQYYADTRLVFISYIAIDDEARLPKNKIVICLFRKLIRYLESMSYDWRAITGELEEYKSGTRHSALLHARTLMIVFQQSLRKLAQSYGIDTDLYRICIDYHRPILRPDEIGTTIVDASFNQWLAFVPRNKDELISSGTSVFIQNNLAADVLRLILLETYADAFKDNATYKAYPECPCRC